MTEEWKRKQRQGLYIFAGALLIYALVFAGGIWLGTAISDTPCERNEVLTEVVVAGEETSVLCISMVEFNELDADGRIVRD